MALLPNHYRNDRIRYENRIDSLPILYKKIIFLHHFEHNNKT